MEAGERAKSVERISKDCLLIVAGCLFLSQALQRALEETKRKGHCLFERDLDPETFF